MFENFVNSKELEDAGSSLTEKEFVKVCNDAESILTRSSENSKSRKSLTSEDLEGVSEKEKDIDDVEVNKNLMAEISDNIKNPISRAILEHDIGLLKFSEESEKAVATDALRIEIVKFGSKYFQKLEGPFLPTNTREMNKIWLKKIKK